MNRLLIRGEPTGPFQRLYVFDNNTMVESIGVSFDDLTNIAFEFIKKYNIEQIDLSGSRNYLTKIEENLKEANATKYSINNLTFRYV